MAFYNRNEIPSESPLGLNETSISDKDKEAHKQLREDLVKNEEKQKIIDEKKGFNEAYERQQEIVLNDGEKRGFWKKVYDRYLGREMPHVTETTQEKYKAFQEKAQDLGTKQETLKEVKQDVKALDYELAVRKQGTAEFAPKDKTPFSKEDALALHAVVEKQKFNAKYNGLKYTNVDGLLKDATDISAMETALSGIKKMKKVDMAPQDIATVNKLEYKLNQSIRREVFHDVVVMIGQDTKNKYTPEQIKMFITPPDGNSISKEELSKALEVFNNLRKRTSIPTEEEKMLARAEKIIRQLGNLPTGEVKLPKKRTKRETKAPAETTTSDSVSTPDSVTTPDIVDDTAENKAETVSKQKTKNPTSKKPAKSNVVSLETLVPSVSDSNTEAQAGEAEESVDATELGDETNLNVKAEVEEKVEKLTNKEVLFKKVAGLLNKDTSTYYSDLELRVFAYPSSGDKLTASDAEYGLSALEKLKFAHADNAETLTVVKEAEKYIYDNSDIKPRVEKADSKIETQKDKDLKTFAEIAKLIEEDTKQTYFQEEVEVFEDKARIGSLDSESVKSGVSALERLSKKKDLSKENLDSIARAQKILALELKRLGIENSEKPEFVPFKGKDVVVGYNAIWGLIGPGKGSEEFKMSLNPKNNTIELVPNVTRFATKSDYNTYYKQAFDCPNPKGGSLDQVVPAILKQTGEGEFKIEQKGSIVVG